MCVNVHLLDSSPLTTKKHIITMKYQQTDKFGPIYLLFHKIANPVAFRLGFLFTFEDIKRQECILKSIVSLCHLLEQIVPLLFETLGISMIVGKVSLANRVSNFA